MSSTLTLPTITIMTLPKKYVWGKSIHAKKLSEEIELVADTDLTVIITGESGTGKEYVANAIHHGSKRKKKPLVAVDCGTLSDSLAESELFGHITGAFTGATQDTQGHFERAAEGTLFLDEITNLSYANQVKLLRVLQERRIRKVGDDNPIEIDVRIIVASNENLEQAVAQGNFREDLYHRLNEYNIHLEPLRKRKGDIPIFIQHFLQEANLELQKNIQSIDTKAWEKLVSFSWPGNLRELRNIIRRSVLEEQTDTLKVDCLLPHREAFNTTQNGFGLPVSINGKGLEEAIKETETTFILQALEEARYDINKAADLLKIHRRTLYSKMNKYGIEWRNRE